MILHTVNKSPFSNNSFIECLRFCLDESGILLIEDGVYACQQGTVFSQQIEQHPRIKFYALIPDLKARGLIDRVMPEVELVDDSGFVNLVTQYQSIQSWF